MITTFYILVLIRLHKIRRKHRSELKERSHRKVTRIVLAVITAYFICWVPYWFLQIFITIDPLIQSLRLHISILPANKNMRFLKELSHLTTIIGYANNCLNPLLYVFLSDSFREEYLIVLNCFNFRGANQQTSKIDDNIQSIERKSNQNQRKSFVLRKKREIAMKKIKHSVAIDEIPPEYRRFSMFHRPSNDQNCLSNPLVSSKITNKKKKKNADKSPNLRELSATERNSLNNQSNRSTRKTTVTITTKSIIDDGGVYCGE